jgi:hypothetical protein
MRVTLSRSLRILAAALAATLAGISLPAQTASQDAQIAPVPNRIVEPIDDGARVTLTGYVHPLATAAYDRGPAPVSMPVARMQLVFKRSNEQESELRQLISALHTPGSPSYHQWLTPQQFGQRFGPSDQDIATVESWLSSQGFQVTRLNPGKQTLEFSGNVAQVKTAFGAVIHKYLVDGQEHYATANAPQIPSALAPVVGGFVSLNNFRAKSYARVLGKAAYNPATNQATPQWTIGNGGAPISNNYVLSPADFGVQYDLPNASLNANYSGTTYDGTGQTIAIVNDSNINVTLANQFRTLFGLKPNPPQVIIDGNDPGIDGINNPDGENFDSVEAYLDVEWSGAVAPGATVDLVIAADTALESGLFLAAEHAVYGDVAPVMSISFGACESSLGSTNSFLNQLWEQAAAQGITVMVSSGDDGSAGCDNDVTQYYAINGLAVNGYASTPFNVAVGGTDFYYSSWNQGTAAENTQIGTYWGQTDSNSTPKASIRQVIPEQPWNDSQYGLDVLSYYQRSGETETTIAAGSGGASSCSSIHPNTGTCSSGYAKPAWQSGPGVPSDSVRDLPDVSLFAADGMNDSYYPECYQDGDCQPASSGGTVQITAVGGTSVASPSFAGMMALINQKYGRQGQADFVLYPLAAQYPAAFHDIVNGTNSVPCAYAYALAGLSSPNCIPVSHPLTVTDPTNGTSGEGEMGTGSVVDYNATPGFDLASGLGSIDANQLLNDWGNIKFGATTATLTPSSTSFVHGTAITISGSVTGTGSNTPTGEVALMTSSTEPVNQGQTFFPLSNGAFSQSVNLLPGGSYAIWGQYGGDTSNAAATTAQTQITVSPEASSVNLGELNANSSSSSQSSLGAGSLGMTYGTQIILSAEAVPTSYYTACVANINPPSSCSTQLFTEPTGTVTFTDNGVPVDKAVVNAEGDAEFNGPWGVGTHSVAANYSGDSSYNSSSATVTFSILPDTPTITVTGATQNTSTGSFSAGQPTVYTFQVENSGASSNSSTGLGYYGGGGPSSSSIPEAVPVAAPTGTITVAGFPPGVPNQATLSPSVDPSTFQADGVATLTLPPTTPSANYSLTINYSGDANYSPTITQQSVLFVGGSSSLLASSTSATASASATSPTAGITATVTVTGVSGKPAPTGTVILFSSGFQFGSVTLPASSTNQTTATALLTSQNLFQGANLITVQYSGDSNYAPSSTTLTISNPLSDFSMVPASSIVSVPAGGSGSVALNLTSVNGFQGTVHFTCAVAATPANGASCSVNPNSFTLAAGAQSASMRRRGITLFTSGGGAALACILLFTLPARRRRWRAMLGVVLLVCAVGFGTGCGYGRGGLAGTTAGANTTGQPFTPTSVAGNMVTLNVAAGSTKQGNYNVLVTGTSGAFVHTLSISAAVK